MKQQITINKEWYDKLVVLVDKLTEAHALEDDVEIHGWMSHLMGYVHSLDEYFKQGEIKKLKEKRKK